jgi:hypothetical protein
MGLVGGDPGVRWAACWGCQEEVKEGVSCCLSVLSGGLARRCGGGLVEVVSGRANSLLGL